jgi:hypothetical protein
MLCSFNLKGSRSSSIQTEWRQKADRLMYKITKQSKMNAEVPKNQSYKTDKVVCATIDMTLSCTCIKDIFPTLWS